jgi:plastocyanin
MNDNKKTKIKTTKAIIAAATILAVVASVAMIGIQTQMSQYALAKHAAREVIPETSLRPNHIAIVGRDSPFFIPNKLTVNVGTIVTIKNHDAIIHTATATDNHSFDTGLLQSGQQKQITFSKPGTYNYFCQVHPFMRGTIVVMA